MSKEMRLLSDFATQSPYLSLYLIRLLLSCQSLTTNRTCMTYEVQPAGKYSWAGICDDLDLFKPNSRARTTRTKSRTIDPHTPRLRKELTPKTNRFEGV